MDREFFLEAVRQQYAEEIAAAFKNCEIHHFTTEKGIVTLSIDVPKLNGMLGKLQKGAAGEGLVAGEFGELCRIVLPSPVQSQLDWGFLQAKKAA